MSTESAKPSGRSAALPPLAASFGAATARTEGDLLVVSTGTVERRWRWTGQGLATVGLKDLTTGREWAEGERHGAECDWSNSELFRGGLQAEVVTLTAREHDDEGFTSSHLEVAAEIAYSEAGVTVRYVIWAYPEAGGLRTQLWVKGRTAADGQTSELSAERTQILAVNGERIADRQALSAGGGSFAYMQSDAKELVFRVVGMKQGGNYSVGMTWWDSGRKGRRQSVLLTSVDGELVIEAVAPRTLPVWEEGTALVPETLIFPVPESVRPDGTATLRIPALSGRGVVVSEVYVYEHSGKSEGAAGSGKGASESEAGGARIAEMGVSGSDDASGRLAELSAAAPTACLAAYWNAGQQGPNRAGTDESDPKRSVDFVPITSGGKQVRAIGYYNDTQNRNKPETPVLREELVDAASAVDWASIVCIEANGAGLMIVKESHKCVNQPGVDTGSFIFNEVGLYNTGWGLSAAELEPDRYKWCWASWSIAYSGGDVGRELALKRFDRTRYPVKPERDMWSVVCTWGHCLNPRDGRNYASETEVLKEMEIVADLGMDMLLIDDGWQVSQTAPGWNPDGGIGWKPHPETYPEGWKRVAALRDRLGVRLGLWGVAQHTEPEDMVWNYNRLGMEQFKLDFAALKSHTALDELMRKVRRFMLETGQKCIISWDTTENAARYGYYWAREYGNVHFMNRKPEKPISVVYVPWLALRDFWQLAKYQNLNKWQLVIQNPEVVDREHSDAYLHSPSYCIATAFMGIPEFMAVPRYYSEAAREEIRPLMALYMEHQRDIFDSYIFSVGEEPSGASWTGFQAWKPSMRNGYLTLFRERLNGQASAEISLKFIPQGTKLKLIDLRQGTARMAEAGEDGRILFQLDKPGEFLFLKYEVES